MLVENADAEALSIRAISLPPTAVTAPSIYRHFEDVDALVLAACERTYDRFGDVLNADAAHGTGPLGEIMGRALADVKFALANPGQYRVLFMTPGSQGRQPLAVVAAPTRGPEGDSTRGQWGVHRTVPVNVRLETGPALLRMSENSPSMSLRSPDRNIRMISPRAPPEV